METSIGGVLIIGVLLTAMVFMSRAAIIADTQVGTAIKEAAHVSGERSRTDINVESFTNISTKIDIDVKNIGNTSIADLARLDYIVRFTKTAGGGTRVVERLAYDPGSSANGTWDILTHTPDSFQPNIWDPGETINMSGNVSGTPKPATTGQVWVSTPNGVVAIGQFTVP